LLSEALQKNAMEQPAPIGERLAVVHAHVIKEILK
jgi:hypothetical protein